MSGETQASVSGWTVDTLRVHMDESIQGLRNLLEARLDAMEKATQEALHCAEKAVSKAETATDKRIEGLNELRRVVNDIAQLQMPRAEAEQRISAVAESVTEIKDKLARMESHESGGRAKVSGIYAALGAVVAVMSVIILAANGFL